MAISSVAKNFRDGTITLADNTPTTPISITSAYENGDFSISGLEQGQSHESQNLIGAVAHYDLFRRDIHVRGEPLQQTRPPGRWDRSTGNR